MSFHQAGRPLGMVRMHHPRSFFFRCAGCGAELIHTVDTAGIADDAAPQLQAGLDVASESMRCHCGGAWEPAGIPRLVNPDEGGDGMIFEVKPLVGWAIEE